MWSFRSCRTAIVSGILALTAIFVASHRPWSPHVTLAQVSTKSKSQNQPPVAAADARNQDREAIRAFWESLAKAFEARDAKALAAQWSAEGEYHRDDGATIQGQEGLEKAFAALFAKTPEVKAEIRSESLRFLSADSAIDEGTVAVQRGAAEAFTNARYHALLVREKGRWKLAQLNESSIDSVTIAELGWLIGEWKSVVGEGAEIRTTYAWAPNKKFIRVEFSLKENSLTLRGSQVIGVDPATGAFHTWTFESDGGVGEADWARDGDDWVLEVTGTLADGRTLTETNVLRRVNADTVTWQSINRMLDEDPIPDLPPVKVTRVVPQK